MALRTIRVEGDPVLGKVCREVTEVTPKIVTLIDDMLETMYEANGVGLAAPQVGILKRIVVIDVGEGPIVMINPEIIESDGEQTGRKIPKHAHGTATLGQKTSSVRRIVDAVLGVYDEKADPKLTVRRLTVTASRLMREEDILREPEQPMQVSLFDDPAARERQLREEEVKQERERRIQEAMLGIKKKYGKNAILSGGSYLDGATARERNRQIGGHKA